jgi:hypothetical protein
LIHITVTVLEHPLSEEGETRVTQFVGDVAIAAIIFRRKNVLRVDILIQPCAIITGKRKLASKGHRDQASPGI